MVVKHADSLCVVRSMLNEIANHSPRVVNDELWPYRFVTVEYRFGVAVWLGHSQNPRSLT